MKTRRAFMKVSGAFAVACMTVATCVWAAPYNPARLAADQLAQVERICQNVMGLDPTEPLVWGMHTGVSNLDTWTSHYRGCVLALSNSLSEQRAQAVANPSAETATAGGPTAHPSRSFYTASNREISRREQLACAELGLTPDSTAFAGCVRDLKRTFFAIENPVT